MSSPFRVLALFIPPQSGAQGCMATLACSNKYDVSRKNDPKLFAKCAHFRPKSYFGHDFGAQRSGSGPRAHQANHSNEVGHSSAERRRLAM